MVKKLAKPKPKQKPKQKQTQRQRQSVVVNVIQPKRTRVARTTSQRGGRGGVGGGFVGGVRPVYVNSPSDYAPIIRNVELPPMFIRDSQLSLPTTLPPRVAVPDYPIPTELQANREDTRPLVSNTEPIIMTENPMRIRPPSMDSPFFRELKQAQEKRDSGISLTPSRPKMTDEMEKEQAKKVKDSLYQKEYRNRPENIAKRKAVAEAKKSGKAWAG